MRRVARSLVLATLSGAAFPASAEGPLRVRDGAPVALIYGLPRALGGDVVDGGELTATTSVANNFVSAADETVARFDGETLALTLGYRAAFGRGARYEWGIEIPYLIHQGGVLDALIESYHELFGFENGGRDHIGRGNIDYFVAHDGDVVVDAGDDGFGDARISGAIQLRRDAARAWALRAAVELPTGDAGDLTGSEGLDVALWTELTERAWLAHWHLTVTAAAGFVLLGEGELLPEQQRDAAAFGHLGLRYHLDERWSLLMQLDGHSEVIDSHIDQLGGASLLGSLGVRFEPSACFFVDAAVIEDVHVESTSDVAFQVQVSTRL